MKLNKSMSEFFVTKMEPVGLGMAANGVLYQILSIYPTEEYVLIPIQCIITQDGVREIYKFPEGITSKIQIIENPNDVTLRVIEMSDNVDVHTGDITSIDILKVLVTNDIIKAIKEEHHINVTIDDMVMTVAHNHNFQKNPKGLLDIICKKYNLSNWVFASRE